MCAYRIIVLGFMLLNCKGTAVVQQEVNYKEDLSVHRPVFENIEHEQVLQVDSASSIMLDGHITEEIDSITRIIISRNQAKKYWDGYTIQVYSGISRQEADEVLKTVESIYAHLSPEMTYYRPSYRVKLGRFFDRLEATKFFNEIRISFPKAILLPGKIPLTINDE